MPGAARRNLGLGTSLASSEKLGSSGRVTPWVFAADSAKISTLEIVAEKIEEGQLALEGAMERLEEIDRLLGRHPAGRSALSQGDPADEDIWLADNAPSNKAAKARKRVEEGSHTQAGDVWDVLDGSLGLIRSDDGGL